MALSVLRLDRDPGPTKFTLSLPLDLVSAPVWAAVNPATARHYQTALGQFFAYQVAYGLDPWLPSDRDAHSSRLVGWLMALGTGCWGHQLVRAFCGFSVGLNPCDNLRLRDLEIAYPPPLHSRDSERFVLWLTFPVLRTGPL